MIVDNLSLMVAYLFLLLCIPAYVFLCSERDSVLIYKVSAVVQIFLTSLFYLIWGGYSADAPIYNEASIWYSFEFPNVNWYYLFKVLFYYPLSLLNKIIHPPWPRQHIPQLDQADLILSGGVVAGRRDLGWMSVGVVGCYGHVF
jgi:hypothetical protein